MSGDAQQRLFKKLTPDNWLNHDTTADAFVKVVGARSYAISDQEWAEKLLEPQLSQTVPREVSNLFEVAQGVMCYGCFFYPLYTLGSEQIFRVMDAALQHRCQDYDIPKRQQSFNGRLQWLKDHRLLSEDRFARWDAVRRLRNSASHADRQSLFTPSMAVSNLWLARELIDELFTT